MKEIDGIAEAMPSLIIVRSFIPIALVFLTGQFPAGAAAVAELLLVAGGAEAVAAGLTVIGGGAGEGEFALLFWFLIH